MELLALAGVVGLLFVKEAGVPVPVPGDLLVIGTGAALAGSPPAALVALAAILVAGYAGGTIQFALMRRAVRRVLLSLLARVGVPRERIERLAERLRRGGARGVAIARMTPGVRIGSIAACGLADLPTSTFVRGLVAGNTVFVAGHFVLGFALGASAQQVLGEIGRAAVPVIVAMVLLAALGGIGWLVLRRRSRAAPAAAWTDAACPACLAVAFLEAPERSTAR